MKKEIVILLVIFSLLIIISPIKAGEIKCNVGDEAAFEQCKKDHAKCTMSTSNGETLICWTDEPKLECKTDTDCTSGKICSENKCIEKKLECQTDTDCTSGKICSENKCIEKKLECQSDKDCAENQRCSASKCITQEREEEKEIKEETIIKKEETLEDGTRISIDKSTREVKLEVTSPTNEKAQLVLNLVEEKVYGKETIKKPKLDIKIETKKIEKISPKVDLKKSEYSFYLIILLLISALIILLRITKDLHKHRSLKLEMNKKEEYMNKRGQVFLLAAIIFILALYSITITYNSAKTYPALEDFKEQTGNYQNEFPKVINYAIYNGSNVTKQLDEFTTLFLSEARKKDPNFGVFYVYKDSLGNIHLVNTLNNKVLNIKILDPSLTAERVALTLYSDNGNALSSGGQICVQGLSCVSTSTQTSNFGSGFSNEQVIREAKELQVEIVGTGDYLSIDLEKFTSMTYVSSNSQPIQSIPGQIDVSIEQY